jgi:hypothetical protein
LILLALLIVAQSSRPDRIVAAYPVLFAAGASLIDRFNQQWLLNGAVAIVFAGGLILAPAGLPVLEPDTLARYARTIGVIPQIEKGKPTSLPQWFGDRFDWDELYVAVGDAYESLSPEERKKAVVLGAYYGHAGAVEHFGKGRIPVISGHNSYHLWGYGIFTGEVVLAVGFRRSDLEPFFEEVTLAGTYSRRYSNDVSSPVFVCRRLKMPLPEAWRRVKVYI